MKNSDKALEIREVQKVSLEILKFVANICESHNMRYWLAYGTLIGAIRHKGFIPWDDDVDIIMPRPDYERFLSFCQDEDNKSVMGVYEIFNRNVNKNYLYGITRVCDSRYEIVKADEKNCGMGIFIDIYPYDGLGNDKNTALKKLYKTRFYCDTIADMIKKGKTIPPTLNFKGKIAYILNMIKQHVLGLNYYHNKLNLLRENYSYDSSDFVGPLMWYFTKPEKVLFPRDFFDVLIRVKFEDAEFFVPEKYHDMLTQEYGDYMQLPPLEKRIYHHQYKAYKK